MAREATVRDARDFSVYPVWITGAPCLEYLKVRADEGALGIGCQASVQLTGEKTWRRARVVEMAQESAGFCIGLELEA